MESLAELRVAELKEQLSNRGLLTCGLKEELVKRLREAMENEQNISDENAENPPETNTQAVEERQQKEPERRDESEEKFSQLLAVMMQMKSGIEETKSGMEEGQKRMDSKLEGMDSKLEETKSGINLVSTKVESIGEEIKVLEKKTDERFEESKERFESMERKFEKIEQEIEKKVSEKFSKSFEIPREILSTENDVQYVQHIPTVAKQCIKLSTYDGKTSWQVYKTQFAIVAEANGWDSTTQAQQLVASLRAEAADILRTIPEDQRMNFQALSDTLELRFGEKCLKDYSRLQLKTRQQRSNETLQELATDVERLSHLAFSDCPAEVRETLALQYFIDGVGDNEIQRALRMAELKDLKSALVYSMKFEAAQQASRKDRYSIRGAEIQQNSNPMLEMMSKMTKILEEMQNTRQKQEATTNKYAQKKARCWTCGAEDHFQRQCRARQGQRAGAPTNNSQGN